MKSRGVYETPGGTILVAAARELESLTLDRETMQYKVSRSSLRNCATGTTARIGK